MPAALALLEPLYVLAALDDAESEAAQGEQLARALAACAGAGIARAWVEIEATNARAASLEVLHRCTAAASLCAPLRVVAAAIDPAAGSWIRLAEDAATADGLLGGRLELGFAALPADACLASLRAAWSGARVEIPGAEDKDGWALHIEVHPRPVHPDGPPLWVRARDEPAAREAGERELCAIAPDVEVARAYAGALRDAYGAAVAIDLESGSERGLELAAAAALAARARREIPSEVELAVRVPLALDSEIDTLRALATSAR